MLKPRYNPFAEISLQSFYGDVNLPSVLGYSSRVMLMPKKRRQKSMTSVEHYLGLMGVNMTKELSHEDQLN